MCMKKLIIIFSVNIVMPFLLLIVLPSILITVRKGVTNSGQEINTSLIKSKPIKFNFISNQSNLQELTIKFKNPGILNNSHISFDINSPTSSRSIDFYGNNVGDPDNVPLKFFPFTDPKYTIYDITISTDNINHSSLYIITDINGTPIFTTYYSQTNFIYNIKQNFQNQFDLFFNRSIIHNIFYLGIIFILNFLILKS